MEINNVRLNQRKHHSRHKVVRGLHVDSSTSQCLQRERNIIVNDVPNSNHLELESNGGIRILDRYGTQSEAYQNAHFAVEVTDVRE